MRNLRTVALILFLSLFALCVVHASADENVTNGSYVIVEMPQIDYNFTHFPAIGTYRIEQGSNVYLNDTIDISGMGHGQLRLAWYGKYSEYNDPQYIISFTLFKREQMNFWIDPAIFSTRTGMWYQYYGNITEPNGNLAAFRVLNGHRNLTVTFPNGTVVNQTEYIRNASMFKPLVIPQTSVLPEVHVADYLLAIGDPLIIKTGEKAHVWIFGRVDQTYGETDTDNMTFEGKRFENFEPGLYTMVIQRPGKNTEFDIRYSNKSLQYRDGWNGVKTIDTQPMVPQVVYAQLVSLLGKTDDDYTIYSLEIQQPERSEEHTSELQSL
jgi:hypothetical protein